MMRLNGFRLAWDAFADICEFFGRLGDEFVIKPDNRPRYATLCICGRCGTTQMVELCRPCVNCEFPVLVDEDCGFRVTSQVIDDPFGRDKKVIAYQRTIMKVERNV